MDRTIVLHLYVEENGAVFFNGKFVGEKGDFLKYYGGVDEVANEFVEFLRKKLKQQNETAAPATKKTFTTAEKKELIEEALNDARLGIAPYRIGEKLFKDLGVDRTALTCNEFTRVNDYIYDFMSQIHCEPDLVTLAYDEFTGKILNVVYTL